jgi:hypothetical protein
MPERLSRDKHSSLIGLLVSFEEKKFYNICLRRRKDHKLDLFLADQERRPECRRLQVLAFFPDHRQKIEQNYQGTLTEGEGSVQLTSLY